MINTRRGTMLFFAFSMIISFAAVQESQAQPGKTNSLPQVAERFLGTWIGKGAPSDGTQFTSKLIFKWTLNENFLEVQNMINANGIEEQYATTYYGWQPVMGQIVFWSFDKNGTINEGLAELEGDNLKHEWRSFSKGGEIRDWRSMLMHHDNENLTFTVLDGRNEVMSSIKYSRSEK